MAGKKKAGPAGPAEEVTHVPILTKNLREIVAELEAVLAATPAGGGRLDTLGIRPPTFPRPILVGEACHPRDPLKGR